MQGQPLNRLSKALPTYLIGLLTCWSQPYIVDPNSTGNKVWAYRPPKIDIHVLCLPFVWVYLSIKDDVIVCLCVCPTPNSQDRPEGYLLRHRALRCQTKVATLACAGRTPSSMLNLITEECRLGDKILIVFHVGLNENPTLFPTISLPDLFRGGVDT